MTTLAFIACLAIVLAALITVCVIAPLGLMILIAMGETKGE